MMLLNCVFLHAVHAVLTDSLFSFQNQLLSDYQSTTLYRGKSYITIAEDPSLMNAVLLYVKMLHICCHACHVGSCDATSLINVLMSIKSSVF